jgi:glycerol kinase
MKIGCSNLKILEIDTSEIIAIGICNQRETTLLWNKASGEVFNTLIHSDSRLINLKKAILVRTRNKKNFLRSVCGLPLDSCFSAIKIRWLIDNYNSIQEAIKQKECCFGNLDSWIMWNLTGGTDNGIHCTDVTNASRTMLMNLETLEWDKGLCNFFDIPIEILPKIRSSAEVYGYIRGLSVLEGVPIASCMGSNNSALLGQLCLNSGQTQCHFENNTSLMFNTGQEIIYSDYDLLTTVAFQLSPNEKPVYALEGYIGNNCESVDWLKSSIINNESSNNNSGSNEISPVSNIHLSIMNGNCFKSLQESEVIFVPALRGLCAPQFLFQAKGFLSGLSIQTKPSSILTAAKESIVFQTKTILESLRKDCKHWPSLNKLIVGGDFSENVDFLQLLADICCLTIERPQVTTPVGLGSLLSAALTMKCVSLDDFKNSYSPPIDTYYPKINPEISDQRYVQWLSNFKTSLYIHEEKNREEVNSLLEAKTTHQFIMNSLPGCIFVFTSYVVYVFSQHLKEAC